MEQVRKKLRHSRRAVSPWLYAVLLLCTLFTLFPFYILVVSSFKTSYELSYESFSLWPRLGFSWEGYTKVLLAGDLIDATMLSGLSNTMLVAVPTVSVGLFVSLLSAYGFAKLDFKGRDAMFAVLLLNMMIPGSVTLIASYMIYDFIGWVDTRLPLIVPGLFGATGTIFFLRQYLKGLPNDILESARIDGAGNMKIFFHLIVPLSGPAILSFALINFLGIYNDYLGPLLYLQSPKLYTLQLVLAFFQDDKTSWSAVLAGSVLTLLPMLIVYIVFQKYMLKGISMASGLKA